MLNDAEKKVIAAVQGDIPLTARPFLEIGRRVGLEESEVLRILKDLTERGVMRRFGATLRHQKSGFAANAMVAWRVAEDRIHAVGENFAGLSAVTHCYRRNPAPNWPYNLYTMIHAADEDSCRAIARDMSGRTGETDYAILFSRKELKKTSMRYFTDLIGA